MNLNKNNIYYKRLLKQFRLLQFKRVSGSFLKILLENIKNFDEIIDLNKIKDNSTIDTFIKYNQPRLEENKLSNDVSEKILFLLNEYITEESIKSKESINTSENKYRNIILEKSFEDYIYPNSKYSEKDLLLNLFTFKDVQHIFNDSISLESFDVGEDTIQRIKIRVNGIQEADLFPTYYEMICTKKYNGIECGNKVRFCDVHKHSVIKCTDSSIGFFDKESSHTMKSIEAATPKAMRKLYSYDVVDLLNENTNEKNNNLKVFSLIKLDAINNEVNIVPFMCRNSISYIIISVKPAKAIKLANDILLKDSNNLNFLDDIYKSLQLYFDKYHNIKLTNQNKILGLIYTFMMLNKIIFDIRMSAFVIGKSGSGKTFWSEFFLPMFTNNIKLVYGTSITRNRFLGGQSEYKSFTKNTYFRPGYVQTSDLIICEEATNALAPFFDKKVTDKNGNVFSMMKAVDQVIDIGIQGSEDITPSAVIILQGNVENLDSIKTYRGQVQRRYHAFNQTQGKYKPSWPLFRSIEYYEKNYDKTLAMAHTNVRRENYSSLHYITSLPEAEMGRYSFFVFIDKDDNNNIQRVYLKKPSIKNKIHSNTFIDELKTLLSGEIPVELEKQCTDYYNDEFVKKRNNFLIDRKTNQINTHLAQHVLEIIVKFVYFNNKYYNKDMILHEEDKLLVEDFLRYNYNTLTEEESSMSKRPLFNDFNNNEFGVEEYTLQKNLAMRNKLSTNEIFSGISLENDK